ncbi:MAG: hypothetical protein AB7L09_02970 [Nitrospira sp.]
MKKHTKSNAELALEHVRKFQRFDRHEIVREGPGIWFCADQHTSMYHFRVIMVPGRIIVTGDIGDLVLHVNDRKPLRWALGCRMKPGETYYPLSKLSPDMGRKLFQPDSAEEWLVEQLTASRNDGDKPQVQKYIKMIREWRECHFRDELDRAEQYWFELLDENGEEPISFREYEFGVFFRYEALCWFMQHVNPQDDRFREELA